MQCNTKLYWYSYHSDSQIHTDADSCDKSARTTRLETFISPKFLVRIVYDIVSVIGNCYKAILLESNWDSEMSTIAYISQTVNDSIYADRFIPLKGMVWAADLKVIQNILLGLFLASETSGALTNGTLSRHQIEIIRRGLYLVLGINSVECTL